MKFFMLSARRATTLSLLTTASLSALCTAQTGAAHAADDAAQKPAIVWVGVVFPPTPDHSAIHASIGLAYEFCRARAKTPAAFGVYGDYVIPSSKTFFLSGGDVGQGHSVVVYIPLVISLSASCGFAA